MREVTPYWRVALILGFHVGGSSLLLLSLELSDTKVNER